MEFYKTDLGIVIKDDTSIRLKSTYKKRILTEKEFNDSNPVKINKHKYLEELNTWFKNSKFEWTHNGEQFKRLDNFEFGTNGSISNYNIGKDIPLHDIEKSYLGKVFIVMYHNRIYYTFMSGNYFPQMQLVNFHNKELTSKWTNIKNLAPVFCKDTKKII